MFLFSPKLHTRLNCGSQADEAQSKNAPKKGSIVVRGGVPLSSELQADVIVCMRAVPTKEGWIR